ncbi:transcriptional regulator [Streptomyces sp. NPDC056796]|uniref:transcriptional regulator n=1 Tax=Streptomyces sp. NPDC056796 TaxID=3345947 RepID=UPI003678C39D
MRGRLSAAAPLGYRNDGCPEGGRAPFPLIRAGSTREARRGSEPAERCPAATGEGGVPPCREADRVEFGFLKKQLAVTDGNLSRHLRVLEESGLITVEKGYAGRRPRTWVALTREGARALDVELRALRALVLRLEGHHPAPGPSSTSAIGAEADPAVPPEAGSG